MYARIVGPRKLIASNVLNSFHYVTFRFPAPLLWSRLLSSVARTHYDLFPQSLPLGPPPTGPFSIDQKKLKAEFLKLQAQAHPDLHPATKKSQAEALSARINGAYNTLIDPLLRAQYLLSLHHGIDVSSDETAKSGGEDAELLAMVLEAREEIEAAEAEEHLVEVAERNKQRIDTAVGLLESAFEGGDLETARRETVRLRYWVGIRESIKEWAPLARK
jgi:molecular chaperone HscB